MVCGEYVSGVWCGVSTQPDTVSNLSLVYGVWSADVAACVTVWDMAAGGCQKQMKRQPNRHMCWLRFEVVVVVVGLEAARGRLLVELSPSLDRRRVPGTDSA